MTNGDRIRQMSNEELARIIQDAYLYGVQLDESILYPSVASIKAYLDKEEE